MTAHALEGWTTAELELEHETTVRGFVDVAAFCNTTATVFTQHEAPFTSVELEF